jgi:hypothetical protein
MTDSNGAASAAHGGARLGATLVDYGAAAPLMPHRTSLGPPTASRRPQRQERPRLSDESDGHIPY